MSEHPVAVNVYLHHIIILAYVVVIFVSAMTRSLRYSHYCSYPSPNHFCLHHHHTINFTLHRSSSLTPETKHFCQRVMRSSLRCFISSIRSPSSFLFLLSCPFLPSSLPTPLSPLPPSLFTFSPFYPPSFFLPHFLSSCLLPSFNPSSFPSFLPSFFPSHSNVPVRLLNTSTFTFP